MFERIFSFPWVEQVIATLCLLLLVSALRFVAIRVVRRTPWTNDQLRIKWSMYIRTISLIVLLIGFIFVWSSELRTLALSIFAVAAAAVIATKELILCMLGSFARAGSKAFGIGDRVEIAGTRGDVIDMGLLGTTILEVGSGHQRTGRSVFIPNSIFFSSQIVNETFSEQYVLHVIHLPLSKEFEWDKAEEQIVKIAEQVCTDFVEPAQKCMDDIARKYGLPVPSVEPKAVLHFDETRDLEVILRIPTPARQRGRTEQKILHALLEKYPEYFLKDEQDKIK